MDSTAGAWCPVWLAGVPTDEIEDDAAIAEAAGGAVEEGLAVGEPQLVTGVVAVDEALVARVRPRVAKAEHARVARGRRRRPN
jgi:hypothetical protein